MSIFLRRILSNARSKLWIADIRAPAEHSTIRIPAFESGVGRLHHVAKLGRRACEIAWHIGLVPDLPVIDPAILNFIRDTPTTFEKNSIINILYDSICSINKPDNIIIDLPTNDLIIKCDATKLQRAFINIIVNSIQVLENGGTITIQILEQDDDAIIQISDSGPGIPPEVLPKIFDLLFTTKKDGTGLGLPICKRIIEEEHNGIIQVENNPTRYIIKIPKTQQ